MSALTEQEVAGEFRRRFQHYDGYRSEAHQTDLLRVFKAGAQFAEQAVRANVAAEIREQADTFMRVTLATYDDLVVKAYLDAYRIAERKQP